MVKSTKSTFGLRPEGSCKTPAVGGGAWFLEEAGRSYGGSTG